MGFYLIKIVAFLIIICFFAAYCHSTEVSSAKVKIWPPPEMVMKEAETFKNRKEFHVLVSDINKLVNYLLAKKLLKNNVTCKKCKRPMHLRLKTTVMVEYGLAKLKNAKNAKYRYVKVALFQNLNFHYHRS